MVHDHLFFMCYSFYQVKRTKPNDLQHSKFFRNSGKTLDGKAFLFSQLFVELKKYTKENLLKIISDQFPCNHDYISETRKYPTTKLFFDVLLTVHLSIILVINQLNAKILVL